MVVTALVVLFATTLWIARAMTGPSAAPTSWAAGVAQVGVDQFSLEFDGWTYGSGLQGMRWIDPSGSWHDHGVPSCLRVEPGALVPLHFQTREVTVDQQTWRPIIAIDCR